MLSQMEDIFNVHETMGEKYKRKNYVIQAINAGIT